jgi:hypothetical protein
VAAAAPVPLVPAHVPPMAVDVAALKARLATAAAGAQHALAALRTSLPPLGAGGGGADATVRFSSNGRLTLLVGMLAAYAIGTLTSPLVRVGSGALGGRCGGGTGSGDFIPLTEQAGAMVMGDVPTFSDHEREGFGIPSAPGRYDAGGGKPGGATSVGAKAAAEAVAAAGTAYSGAGHGDASVGVVRPPHNLMRPARHVKCSDMAALRQRFVDYLTKGRPAVMNVIGQMDAEVLLPLIADLMPHEVMMVDIGANVGQTSGAMMAFICGGNCTRRSRCVGKPGTGVVAFEPQRRVYDVLNGAAAAGQWGLCGWVSRNAAVSSAPGKMTLYGGNTHASLGKEASWMDVENFGEKKVETVVVTTVDQVVQGAYGVLWREGGGQPPRLTRGRAGRRAGGSPLQPRRR